MVLTAQQTWQAELTLTGLFDIERLNAAQLHYVAQYGDPHTFPAVEILEHPACDLGTALLIYGKTGAGYQQQYELPKLSGYNITLEDLKFYTLMVDKLNKNEFNTAIFAYDPQEMTLGYEDMYSNGNLSKVWEHPHLATKEILGETIEGSIDCPNGSDFFFASKVSFGLNQTSSFESKLQLLFQENDLELDEVNQNLYQITIDLNEKVGHFENFVFERFSDVAGQKGFKFDFDAFISDESQADRAKRVRYSGTGQTVYNAMEQALENWGKQNMPKIVTLLNG